MTYIAKPKLHHPKLPTNALGFTHEELIDAAELRHLVPAVAESCPGGVVSRRDGAANPAQATTAFRRIIVAEGSQGPRVYEYAELWVWFSEEGLPGPRERLLVRRSLR